MADQPLDPEMVAAFLDGRLPDTQRTRVLARMAEDPAWREIAADAAAMTARVAETGAASDTEGSVAPERVDGADTTARPIGARRSSRRGVGPWLMLAAAASVGVFVLARRDTDPRGRASPATIAPAHAVALALAPDDLRALTTQRWSVVRAGTSQVTATARAVRLGALSVDALLDRAAGGAEARAEMMELLQPLNGSVAGQLLRGATDSASHVQAFTAVRALVNAEAYDVGVWLELLRAGDASARTSPGWLEALERVGALEPRSPEQRALLIEQAGRLAEQLPGGRRADVREAANALLAVLAS